MLHLLRRIHTRCHALMTGVTGHTIEAFSVHLDDTYAVALGQLEQIARARIFALGIDEHFQHTIGVLSDAGGNGMKTVNDA
jgi:hypothetical protein